MDKKYFTIDGKKYSLDIDCLFKYIFTPIKETDSVSKTINQVYDTENEQEKLEIAQKQIVETSESNNELEANLRYDFIVNHVLSQFNEHGDFINFNYNEPSFIQTAYFNMLLETGILKVIE